MDHIQVHRCLDDDVEFLGGTVNVKYVLLTGGGDDSLDWTEGWTERAQFLVIQQYGDKADRGIEADNNKIDYNAMPCSNPAIYNVTLIGSSSYKEGILLRKGHRGIFGNIIVTDFKNAGLKIADEDTMNNLTKGSLRVNNALTYNNNPNFSTANKERFILLLSSVWEDDPDLILRLTNSIRT